MKLKTLVKRIEKHRAGLIKHRDALRDLIQEATAMEDDADTAQDELKDALMSIEHAADYISRNC